MGFLAKHLLPAPGECASAAVIAALVSTKGDAHAALESAKQRFVTLNVEEMVEADLSAGTTLTDASGRCLAAKTKHTPLGSCDAFFSHSWRDEETAPYTKFFQLMRCR